MYDFKEPGSRKRSRTLTDKQKKYVEFRLKGMSKVTAMKHAGYQDVERNAGRLETQPHIREALEKGWRKQEKMADMSKKKVLDGIMEAIEQAKMLADPSAQISGWREIAKMCGYYEPNRLQVEVSIAAKRIFSQYESLSDEELLKLADSSTIEAEDFKVIDESSAS